MEGRRDKETGGQGDKGTKGSNLLVPLSPCPPVPLSSCLSLSPSELREIRRLVKHITQNLEAAYGVPVNDSPYDPLSELILTILSQATTDTNSRRAFKNLKRRFPDWESARRARASMPNRGNAV